MQMYPRDGGYKEQYYHEEVENYVVRDDADHMNMMMKPHDHHGQHHGYGGHADQFKHDQHGYGGHADQFKGKYGQHASYGYGGHDDKLMKNGYGQHGYGGHDDRHKNGVESYSTQYAELWNAGNDYSGHGGKHQSGHGYGHNGANAMKHNGYGAHDGHNAMMHNGYGAHEGHYGSPNKEHQISRVPVWKFKGISD